MKNLKYKVIGVMSGTSLDGIDIAFCEFSFKNNSWKFKIKCAETIPYSSLWKNFFLSLEKTDALTFQQAHLEYGFYIGELVKNFSIKNRVSPDFVASHGHTIFHADFKTRILKSKNKKPLTKKLTVQIGSGSAIAAQCGLPVVCDFRSLDTALGGQGAPLVPIGDMLLFSQFEYCLNLGGFANISYQYKNKRIAFDICPVNIVMNTICVSIGKEYDSNGELALSGKINEQLLGDLDKLAFYHLPSNTPKSLGKEWVLGNINPLLKKYKNSPKDLLRTFVEHIATQIAGILKNKSKGKILVTGGGAFNKFLISEIQKKSLHKLIIPDKNTIEFKEALIFAFLGVLRMRNEVNSLKSVTGAAENNVGGAVYYAA